MALLNFRGNTDLRTKPEILRPPSFPTVLDLGTSNTIALFYTPYATALSVP
jgi:hypothetical protein